MKIYMALMLSTILTCTAQITSSRRSSVTQRQGEARTSSHPASQALSRSSEAKESQVHTIKYRRKPKQAYYPRIISSYRKATPNNGYEFQYLTEDGVQRAERGYLSPIGVWTVEGSVASLSDDNYVMVQSYIADASGYKSSVKRYSPDNYNSLDDFLPWAIEPSALASEINRFDDEDEDDDKLGSGTIMSLLGAGGQVKRERRNNSNENSIERDTKPMREGLNKFSH